MSDRSNEDVFKEPPLNPDDVWAMRGLSVDALFEGYDVQTNAGNTGRAMMYLMEIQRRRDVQFQKMVLEAQQRMDASQARMDRRDNEMLWLTRAVVVLAVATLAATIVNAIPLVCQWLG